MSVPWGVAMLSATGRIMDRSRLVSGRLGALLAGVLVLIAVAPQSAQAHGATDPVASSYLARVKVVPAGLTARVVDGDLRLWLRARVGESLTVLDYRGAPYLRFAHGHVWANQNSEMYYFNQTPPLNPPLGLSRNAPERWLQVGTGNTYEWHDGRLHAFALQALPPGSAYAGPWQVPVLLDGRAAVISGSLWYRGGPSIAWFWPIAILVLCVLAAWRLRDPRIDTLVAKAVAGLTLCGITLAAVGRDLHGRPGLSMIGVVELTFIAGLAAWTAWRILRGRAGSLTYFLVAVTSVWEAISLIPTLFNGYVLLAVPPFLGRLATVICLGGPIALVWPAVRVFRREQDDRSAEWSDDEVFQASA